MGIHRLAKSKKGKANERSALDLGHRRRGERERERKTCHWYLVWTEECRLLETRFASLAQQLGEGGTAPRCLASCAGYGAEDGADGAKSGHYEMSATEIFSGANNGAQRERSSLSCKLIETIEEDRELRHCFHSSPFMHIGRHKLVLRKRFGPLSSAIALSPEGIVTAGSHACLQRVQTPTIWILLMCVRL
jgi:hypothetical protein